MNELDRYDYDLPTELLALRPPERREDARLMVIDRSTGTIRHESITDLPQLLEPGDCLVMNDTRVIPARLSGLRTATRGKWEGLFLGTGSDGTWRVIGETRGQLKPGESITIVPANDSDGGRTLVLSLEHRDAVGVWTARPDSAQDALCLLETFGTTPLPPYLGRRTPDEQDRLRYQTTFARRPGAIAAPTAGLHFTPKLLDECRLRDVATAWVTLHVGIGTFRPISGERLEDHVMHAEWCSVPRKTIEAVTAARQQNRRVIAVGTTTVRSMESAAHDGEPREWEGMTELFIRPGFQFRVTDALLTNFHLPRSTLLVLVSVFAGHDLLRTAYQTAIEEKYRFYSYGDAMLIL